jgi:hypothetical protein
VTLDCGLVDIATSVGRVSAAVHPPAVLRLRDQPARAAHLGSVAEFGPATDGGLVERLLQIE